MKDQHEYTRATNEALDLIMHKTKQTQIEIAQRVGVEASYISKVRKEGRKTFYHRLLLAYEDILKGAIKPPAEVSEDDFPTMMTLEERALLRILVQDYIARRAKESKRSHKEVQNELEINTTLIVDALKGR